MKNSLYFKHELTCNREHYKNVEEIFVQMKEDFEELKLLFEKNWESKIMKEKILKYYNEIYKNDKNLLKEEIKVLMNYHDIYITEQEITTIIDKIFIYYLKQSNLYNINYSLNSIKNETESYFKEYKTILLEMKEMIRYKDFDEISVKTKASDCDNEKSEKEKYLIQKKNDVIMERNKYINLNIELKQEIKAKNTFIDNRKQKKVKEEKQNMKKFNKNKKIIK